MEWHKYERHPLSAEYGDLAGTEWDDFIQGFRDNGNAGRKIVLFENKILDGWQLYRAHVQEKVEPEFKDLPKKWHDKPEQYVAMVNDRRRHETVAQIAERSRDRRQRVVERREAGESTRAIAEAEGVSQTTVQRYLDSGEPGGSPGVNSHKVTGQDGKQYPASNRKLCDRCSRCQRTGQTVPKSCPECRDLNSTGKKHTKREPKAGDKPVDAFGNELPARCRDAYCDPWIQDTFDLLALTNEKLLKARIGDGMNKRARRYPFFVPKDFIDGAGFVTTYIEQLVDHLKLNRPAGVCPSCAGKGCPDCRQSGLVPRAVYEKLNGAKK